MDVLEFDREHLWHPYTSMVDPLPSYHVVGAEGTRLHLADGTELIDGMSSWWCAIHGYNHPRLNEAIRSQLSKTAHIMFGGITHAPAVDLGSLLLSITPDPLQHVFFADSGSVSVEVAIKMAFQYWIAQGQLQRNKLLTLRGGYHGDTFAAMSVCDPVNGMHESFREILPKQIFVDRPETRPGEILKDSDQSNFELAITEHSDEIAAVILEPVVQGAGGMWFYSPEYLVLVRELCDRFGILLIFDEIATGFGRTGSMFACEHAGVVPDIMCVGKALTGGYLSLAATLTTTEVAQGVSRDGGVLMHGPTFMANPLCCAVARENVSILMEGDYRQQVSRIAQVLTEEFVRYQEHPAVQDVRTFGAIGVVQTRDLVPVADLQRIFVSEGVWIRPFNDLIYLMPPYIITDADLCRLTQAIGVALNSLPKSG